MLINLIFIFIFGLIIGSFLNVLVYRLKNGGRIFWDRSRCPFCKKELNFFDLIPVLSFLFNRGRCRYCNKKISWQYPLVELGTALIFIFTYLNLNILEKNFSNLETFGRLLFFSYFLFIIASLIVIFVYDLRYYLIPDIVLLPAIFITFLFLIFGNLEYFLKENIIGALIFSGFFLFQYILSQGKWVGGGDIKLGFLLGLILGWKLTLVCLFLSYISGAIVSFFLLALGIKNRKDVIPFGPFLIFTFIFCLFYGYSFLNWYFNLLV